MSSCAARASLLSVVKLTSLNVGDSMRSIDVDPADCGCGENDPDMSTNAGDVKEARISGSAMTLWQREAG
jgi:hypothetical protein